MDAIDRNSDSILIPATYIDRELIRWNSFVRFRIGVAANLDLTALPLTSNEVAKAGQRFIHQPHELYIEENQEKALVVVKPKSTVAITSSNS